MEKRAEKKPNHRDVHAGNLQVLQELKFLKTQLAAKDKAILEEANKAHRAQAALQIVGLPDLSAKDFDEQVNALARKVRTPEDLKAMGIEVQS